MDLSLPFTLYPTTLPDEWVWGLFGAAVLVTVVGAARLTRTRGRLTGLVLSVPLAAIAVIASVAIGMFVSFFVHGF